MAKSTEVRVYKSDDNHLPSDETRQFVRYSVACGMTEGDIAYVMGLTPAQVMHHYELELDNGLRVTSGEVGFEVLKNAIKNGDSSSQQFFLKTRGNWGAPTKVEVTGKNGGPIEVSERTKMVDDVMALMMTAIDPRKNDPVEAK